MSSRFRQTVYYMENNRKLSYFQVTNDLILDEIFADNLPTCEKDNCDGVVKPGITKYTSYHFKFIHYITV
jgi:hypothetical protein